jgi:shikimate dehydrogenase
MWALRAFNFAGANVTIPHKRRVVSFCDKISDLSTLTGTVNTIYYQNESCIGTTTDPEGFLRAVRSVGHEPQNGNLVIIGNGGTARTLGFALASERIPKKLTFVGRSLEKVSALALEISAKTGFSVNSLSLDNEASLKTLMTSTTLLVNCTPVGMHPNPGVSPIPARLLHKDLTVFDTIYNPAKTQLIQDAEKVGCQCLNGLRMLLFQGLASFKLWTGVDVPLDIFDLDELQAMI